MVTTAESIAQQLKNLGAEYVFQVTGGDQGLWLALEDQEIRMIPCRSEQGAAYMADGYARASGKFAVVYGQHGPGATNVLSALADARWANSPVVSLTSSIARPERGKFAYQEIDQLLMHAAMTRYATEVSDPDDAPERIARAVVEAVRLPAQPTHVQVPRDLFDVELSEKPEKVIHQSLSLRNQMAVPSPEAVERVAHLLRESTRPLIVAGSGVHASRAYDALAEFAEAQNIPVATSLGGKGSISTEHRLSVGVIGRYSSKVANWAAGRADLILALGTRLGELTTDGRSVFGESAEIIQVDVDSTALSVAYPAAYGIVADVGMFLERVAKHQEGPMQRRERERWSGGCSSKAGSWKSDYHRHVSGRQDGLLSPASVVWELSRCVGPADAVVADTGYMSAWCGVLLDVQQAGHTFFRAAGSLGWAVPGAMGVALARKDDWVVAVTGDGGFAYNAFEIETAVRCEIPVTIIVMNNRTLAFEYHLQKLKYDRVLSHVNDFSDVDYAQVAKDLGGDGRRVSNIDELREAMQTSRASDGPFVIDVLVDKDAIAPVTSYDAVQEREL